MTINEKKIDQQQNIGVVTIGKGDLSKKSRFFILAGEHARELISAESALHFVKVLCGKEKKLHKKAEEALNTTVFQIIVN